MPIVTITARAPEADDLVSHLVSDVRVAGARALKCDPNDIWVVFNGVAPGRSLLGPAPFIVIQANEGRSTEQRHALTNAITQTVARAFKVRPDDVWAHYQELRLRDVWLHGRWSAHV